MAHRLLIDVNVILDVAELREPHYEPSQKVLTLIESKKVHGYLSAASCPIIYYLLRKEIGARDARTFLKRLFELFRLVGVDEKILELALESGAEDFEDGIQAACAEACKADFVITRDASGYKHTSAKTLTPSEYLAAYFF